MRSLMMFSSRKARLWALLTLLTLAATFVPGVPAHAAAATKLALANVDTTMTANRSDSNGIDQINVQAQDGSSQIDNTFASTISFTSSCDPCMAVSVNADMSSPLANNQFTWGPFDLDKGNKNFYVRWTENAVGAPRTLTVASGSLTPDSVSGITVVSNDATRLDLQNVEFGSTVGVADSINVVVKNQANQTNPNVYEGVVVFEASCGNCFTITPHDAGTGNEKQYTFAPGDNASKGFALTWTTAGNNRTFTATDSSLTTTPSETVTGIDVEAAAATTTTSSTSSTTS
ncbi:MAG: hypothetical protein QOI61_1598, partial [Actinomycetota bacterium]